jgi:hypothetical protein
VEVGHGNDANLPAQLRTSSVGEALTSIAARLGRSVSTVSRPLGESTTSCD